MAEDRFQEWCVLELMGHRRLFGLVTEMEIGGASFLRLNVPGDDGRCPSCAGTGDGNHDPVEGTLPCRTCDGKGKVHSWAATQYYSPSAVYCMTPTTEDIARQMAQDNRPEPVHRWELKALEPRIPRYGEGFQEIRTGEDEDDYDLQDNDPDDPDDEPVRCGCLYCNCHNPVIVGEKCSECVSGAHQG